MEWSVILHDLGLIAIGGLLVYLRGYSAQKGKNLATREDIAEITDKVESIRAEYASIRDAIQHRHELSMAALDERLEVHQAAYAWWRRFAFLEESDARFEFFQECEKWWVEHCLYLSKEAEDAFIRAFRARYILWSLPRDYAAAHQPELWKDVAAAGAAIRAAAQLPPLAEQIEKPLARPAAAGAVAAAHLTQAGSR